tara:strand:- start:6 stop:179 length:174 start_codon:yes stop_codon:yes gene_type:complete
MDHILEFERNVSMRIRDVQASQKSISKSNNKDLKPAFLFAGIAFGVISYKIACSYEN